MTRILIVEDEAGLRQGLDINLRLEHYETLQTPDSLDATQAFHAPTPDTRRKPVNQNAARHPHQRKLGGTIKGVMSAPSDPPL